ncbi:hypothetical protein TKK_0002773 [Trichogramma kaykai]|uniref:Uncharacterized protein n=1 Tax=Trichogramma kaykai TaxID=54128 RepID=A0ABD2XSH9_9HYME
MVSKLSLVLLVIGLTYVAAQSCNREKGDTLLDTVSFINVIVGGQPKLDRKYPGYKITCVKCKSLLNGVGKILGLDVLNGGYGCNFVLAQVALQNLLGQCSVYGIKGKPVSCGDD